MVDLILLFLKSGIGITWHWYKHVNVYLVFCNFVNASFILYGTVTWLDDFCGFFPFVTGRSKRTVYIADKLRSVLISFEIENNTCILHFNVTLKCFNQSLSYMATLDMNTMNIIWKEVRLCKIIKTFQRILQIENWMLMLPFERKMWIFFPTEKVKEVVGYSRFDQIRCLSIHGKRLACKRICTYPSCKKDKRSSFIGRRMYKIWWRCGKC